MSAKHLKDPHCRGLGACQIEARNRTVFCRPVLSPCWDKRQATILGGLLDLCLAKNRLRSFFLLAWKKGVVYRSQKVGMVGGSCLPVHTGQHSLEADRFNRRDKTQGSGRVDLTYSRLRSLHSSVEDSRSSSNGKAGSVTCVEETCSAWKDKVLDKRDTFGPYVAFEICSSPPTNRTNSEKSRLASCTACS